MKLIGKDNGKHVVRNGDEVLHLDDAQFAELCEKHPGLLPSDPPVRGLMGGWKHVGKDNGKHVVRSDAGDHHLNDVQFGMLKAGTALKDVLLGKKDEPEAVDTTDYEAIKERAKELGVSLTGKKKVDWAQIVADAEAALVS